MTTPDDRVANPVPVEIKNWAPPVKPPYVKNTTMKTYALDPASSINLRQVQIADYEPNRLRVAILVVDAAITLNTDPPSQSPDTSSATVANTGAYLPPNVFMYEFFGPDAMWINTLAAVTRVVVVKEYC